MPNLEQFKRDVEIAANRNSIECLWNLPDYEIANRVVNHLMSMPMAEQQPSPGVMTPERGLRPMHECAPTGGPDEAGRDRTAEEVRLAHSLERAREKGDQEHARQQCIIQDKELRVRIDKIIQDIRSADERMNGASDERWWSVHYLTNAVHWLGQDLKRLGEANPYPNSRDATNTKVDPTAQGLKL